jgi:hypothetical protein
VAVAGRIVVVTETSDGAMNTFVLDHPHLGVYIPPHVWHTMQYSQNATQLVLASTLYDEKDYIRDHQTFKKVWGKQS